jgi:hypothetical protein
LIPNGFTQGVNAKKDGGFGAKMREITGKKGKGMPKLGVKVNYYQLSKLR